MTSQAFRLERDIWIAAQPQTIFPFFTDPAKLTRWKGVKATLEPQPGGIYRANISGKTTISGRYVEVSPYNRVVFTWGWEGEDSAVPVGSSTVEINLIPEGKGTRLFLRHSNLPNEQETQAHAVGWDHYLPRLAEVASGGDAGPDPWAADS